MDDRVGDILAQRARLESGAGVAIFLSVLFHATLSAIAGWSAWHHASAENAPVMMIRFAQPQAAPEMTPAAPPAPVAQPMPQPVVQPQPKPKAIEKKTAPPSLFGKSTKKAAPVAPVPAAPKQPSNAATSQPSAAAAASDVPVGGAGVTGLEGGDFPYPFYIEQMKRLIGSHWLRPQVGAETASIVYFVIDRDGTIRDVRPETASGNGLYDRAALRAVLEASPLPPLPFGYSGTYLGVHLKFR
jgi:periplasmic protein TonB